MVYSFNFMLKFHSNKPIFFALSFYFIRPFFAYFYILYSQLK